MGSHTIWASHERKVRFGLNVKSAKLDTLQKKRVRQLKKLIANAPSLKKKRRYEARLAYSEV